jgi:TetR/AcrR family transcriptional regulator, lmrAB and yxaGH operons repressor
MPWPMPPRDPPAAPGSTARGALPGARERLLAAMTQALRTRGLHGIGLAELLAHAQAPKGVLYHHFPGGKVELAVAALRQNVAATAAALDRLAAAGTPPAQALRTWLGAALKQLESGGFERGCPLAAVALDASAADTELRQALAEAFALLRERLAATFVAGGARPERALPLATLTVAAYEGALIQARVAASRQPMAETTALLLELIDQELTRR